MRDPVRILAWWQVAAVALLVGVGELASGGMCEAAEVFLHLFAIVFAPLIVAAIAVSPRVVRCLAALAVFKLGQPEIARLIMRPEEERRRERDVPKTDHISSH